MILSVGLRGDVVSYYGDWLANRFREGYVYTRNPLFAYKVLRYELAPDKIDAVYFRSRNYAPFLGKLALLARDYRLFCDYAITPYGTDLEPRVPDAETTLETLLETEKIIGRARLGWRYDPVLVTTRYPPELHFEFFEKTARRLTGHVARCVIAFEEAHGRHFGTVPGLKSLSQKDKRALAAGFARIADRCGLPVQSCGTGDYSSVGLKRDGCATLGLLATANGCSFRDLKHLGNRRGCLCFESRDVGWYDSCPGGCKYCLFNRSPEAVAENLALHDDDSPLLVGRLGKNDLFGEGVQRSCLKGDGMQISFFDRDPPQ